MTADNIKEPAIRGGAATTRSVISRAYVATLCAFIGYANAQQLVPITSTAPYPDEYAIYEDKSQRATYVIAPVNLIFQLDEQTRRPRIGIQYYVDPATKKTKLLLTSAVRFDFNKKKVDEIVEWSKTQKGPQTKVAVMNGAASECRVFAVPSSGQPLFADALRSDVTFDATLQINGTFELSSTDLVASVLKGRGAVGIICQIAHHKIQDARQEFLLTPDHLAKLFKNQGWVNASSNLLAVASQMLGALKIDKVAFPEAQRIFHEWFKAFLGWPQIKRNTFGTEWGWDLSSDQMLKRVHSEGPLNLASGNHVAYVPHRFGVVWIEDVCGKHPSSVINIDSGTGGCNGLK